MWWTGQTSRKYRLFHLSKPRPLPDEHALYKDNFVRGNGELSKGIADVKTAAQHGCSINCCSLTKAQSRKPLRAIAVASDTLFSELYVMRIFSFYLKIEKR